MFCNSVGVGPPPRAADGPTHAELRNTGPRGVPTYPLGIAERWHRNLPSLEKERNPGNFTRPAALEVIRQTVRFAREVGKQKPPENAFVFRKSTKIDTAVHSPIYIGTYAQLHWRYLCMYCSTYIQGRILTLLRFFYSDQKRIEKIFTHRI